MKQKKTSKSLYDLVNRIEGIKLEDKYSNIIIKGITSDSRLVKKDYIFVAIKGEKVNGEDYIVKALESGARIIICDINFNVQINNKDNFLIIKHNNPRLIYALICSNFFDKQPHTISAITGTNGKTSTANFYAQIYKNLKLKSCSIGTIGILDGNNKEIFPNQYHLTTPSSEQIHQILSNLEAKKVNYVAMEASSHGLDQYRLHGVKINSACFTNLSRDHLDYHKTEENYFLSKMKLFKEILPKGKTVVIDADSESEFSKRVIKECLEYGHKIFSIGRKGANLIIVKTKLKAKGEEITIAYNNKEYLIKTKLSGSFQISNLLCAAGLVIANGIKGEEVIAILHKIKPVLGRMEKIAVKNKKNLNVFVDYAHTPDGLEKALKELNLIKKNKLWVVFGCGGNRDTGKRAQMGDIAQNIADKIVITDDNPRNENPELIRKEILTKCPNAVEIGDREQAIAYAIKNSAKNDIILIAGKGHEKFQIIGQNSIPFDDCKIAKQELKKYV